MRVLVVEKNEALLQAMTLSLEAQGLEVCAMSSSLAAVTALNTQSFDALVTDFRLPQLDGGALCQKAQELNPEIITVLVTGLPEEHVEAIHCDAFFQKPLRVGHLVEALRSISKTPLPKSKSFRYVDGVAYVCV